jgi:hypothetical protein
MVYACEKLGQGQQADLLACCDGRHLVGEHHRHSHSHSRAQTPASQYNRAETPSVRSVRAWSIKSRKSTQGQSTGGQGSLFGFGSSGGAGQGEGASLKDSIRGSMRSKRSKSAVGLADKAKPMR